MVSPVQNNCFKSKKFYPNYECYYDYYFKNKNISDKYLSPYVSLYFKKPLTSFKNPLTSFKKPLTSFKNPLTSFNLCTFLDCDILRCNLMLFMDWISIENLKGTCRKICQDTSKTLNFKEFKSKYEIPKEDCRLFYERKTVVLPNWVLKDVKGEKFHFNNKCSKVIYILSDSKIITTKDQGGFFWKSKSPLRISNFPYCRALPNMLQAPGHSILRNCTFDKNWDLYNWQFDAIELDKCYNAEKIIKKISSKKILILSNLELKTLPKMNQNSICIKNTTISDIEEWCSFQGNITIENNPNLESLPLALNNSKDELYVHGNLVITSNKKFTGFKKNIINIEGNLILKDNRSFEKFSQKTKIKVKGDLIIKNNERLKEIDCQISVGGKVVISNNFSLEEIKCSIKAKGKSLFENNHNLKKITGDVQADNISISNNSSLEMISAKIFAKGSIYLISNSFLITIKGDINSNEFLFLEHNIRLTSAYFNKISTLGAIINCPKLGYSSLVFNKTITARKSLIEKNPSILSMIQSNLRIKGDLNISRISLKRLPENLIIEGDADLRGIEIKESILKGMTVFGSLFLSGSTIRGISPDLFVSKKLVLHNCKQLDRKIRLKVMPPEGHFGHHVVKWGTPE